jgi:hypothetical protein
MAPTNIRGAWVDFDQPYIFIGDVAALTNIL